MNTAKKKSLRNMIAADVTTRLTGELAIEDRIAQIQDLLSGLDAKGRRKALRNVDVVKQLRSATSVAKDSAENSQQEVTNAIIAFVYFKGLMGKNATLEALREEVEADLPKAKKKVKRQLDALTKARMQALAVEKAGTLLNDPEGMLRGIIEADDDVTDELPEAEVDEWEEEAGFDENAAEEEE
ncbi:MAG: hypothetical protein HN981_03635 [Candidatus Pacebacteria bacterium]|jgi:hypothetical protein|nr:hypothetical protein [Candidatus Paceibacterota bacterium]MBT4652289.1 hypothetical protein [Candidatus Paceibacterota bacterium]MBT6756482.1 hypothetical protein [Candidatus Paceibacterota bacterium]MBT6921455.1 hypothetical protein [Candidatus Paceibacterota bacterium]